MEGDDGTSDGGFQGGGKIPVEGLEPLEIRLGAGAVAGGMIRIRPDEGGDEVADAVASERGIEPDVGIWGVVVVIVIMAVVMIPVGRRADVEGGEFVDQGVLGEAVGEADDVAGGFPGIVAEGLVEPGFHAETVGDDEVGGADLAEVLGAQLEIVRTDIAGEEQIDVGIGSGDVEGPGVDGGDGGEDADFAGGGRSGEGWEGEEWEECESEEVQEPAAREHGEEAEEGGCDLQIDCSGVGHEKGRRGYRRPK